MTRLSACRVGSGRSFAGKFLARPSGVVTLQALETLNYPFCVRADRGVF